MESDIKSEIERIASAHLGKAGDGSVVKPYVTPDSRDASLLVPIPRHLNRTGYGINDNDFLGHDVWNCYEVSHLADNGYPVNGVMVIEYPSNTPNIVESKSLKLYLNSYNMMKIDAGDDGFCSWHFEEMVIHDLHNALYNSNAAPGSDELMYSGVRAMFYPNRQNSNTTEPFKVQFLTIEDIVDVNKIQFDVFNEDPDTLVVDDNLNLRTYRYHTSSLRSNCRVTNQPDWGDVYIHIKGRDTILPESLLKYIVSLRKENHFHEEICEMIYKRIMDKINPKELFVACLYTRRGGIDINPMRANSEEVFSRIVNETGLMKKTMRQ
jgi:7-cyano-7-deazaguanine reductase